MDPRLKTWLLTIAMICATFVTIELIAGLEVDCWTSHTDSQPVTGCTVSFYGD
jgi:hypothetical protein